MSVHTLQTYRGRRANAITGDKVSKGSWVYGYPAPGNHLAVIQDDGACVEVAIKQGTAGLCSGKPDKNGDIIYQGDVIENENGLKFEIRYGSYAMYCPVDDCMMENIGFYAVAEGFYEDMPIGPTEDYAVIVGNIHDNPELKVDKKYRCFAELGSKEEIEGS